MYHYTVTKKEKDPSNRNIIVTVDFEDDANPGVIYTDKTWATDLNDAFIAKWAYAVIQTLIARDTAFDVITTGKQFTPPTPDPAIQVFTDAQTAYRQKLEDVQISKLGDATLDDMYATFKEARDTLSATPLAAPVAVDISVSPAIQPSVQ